MTASPGRKYGYQIDASDRVRYVSPAWLAFARENGAVELTAERVMGRTLWEFISDTETRHLYRTIFDRVRTDRMQVVIPFRCDSPTLRRFMRLEIGWYSDEVLQLEGVIDRVEPCCYTPIFDCRVPRSDKLLTICSGCKRALVEPRGWLDIEEAAVVLQLFEEPELPQLRQAICPNCDLAASC